MLCDTHNLPRQRSDHSRIYGIRLRLPVQDPLSSLLGSDWESFRWYETEAERDRALAELREEHRFSRRGDKPSLVLEKLTRGDLES